MQLPQALAAAVQEITSSFSGSDLTCAASELTGAYRGQRRGRPQLDDLHRAAYLVTRLPATYAVLARILHECRQTFFQLQIDSLLDLGSGPGTALWATAAAFPELKQATLLENSSPWIEIGKRLAASSNHAAIRGTDWKLGSVTDQLPKESFDLVTILYVLNELNTEQRLSTIEAAWQRTTKLLVIVEPGTPAGFLNIRALRKVLIVKSANIVAPCPHSLECPMSGNNWCHFAERLPRGQEHRLLKNATLGYEDEKYSYVAFSREPVSLPDARILRHPRKHSGHVELELCTVGGLKSETVSRKQGALYKRARKAEWGDNL